MIATPETPAKDTTQQPANAEQTHKRRTFGNKLFDWFVYPTFAFVSVFIFSVWATYQGKYGNDQGNIASRAIRGTFKGIAKGIKNIGVSSESADGHAMVLVSFLAGTLIITPIKWFEDRRIQISKFLDRMFGSVPDDPTAYEQEPKQSWGSVLLGRALTFGSVLVVALTGGKIINNFSAATADIITKKTTFKAINTDFFKKGWLKNLSKKSLGPTDIFVTKADNEATWGWKVSFISAFETFYTALCATMVYFMSRMLARKFNKLEDEESLAQSLKKAVTKTNEEKVAYLPDEPQAAKSADWVKKTTTEKSAEATHTLRVENSRADISPAASV